MDVEGHRYQRIDVNGTLLTQEIYRYLNREWIPGQQSRAGFCHFPVDYKRQHYLQLTADSPKRDKNGATIFDSEGRRNEQLDCRKYALAALYEIRHRYEEDVVGQPLSWPDFWDYVAPTGGET
jgi:phage terminase large subunit GpA-like protein